MIERTRLPSIAAATALAFAVTACSGGPRVAASAPPAATAPAEIEQIAQLLDRGEVKDARKKLEAALRKDKANPSLLVLREDIDGDAKADLGPANHAYTVVAGDTMAGLARRFLGDRLKSYQLARYNGLKDPSALRPGQTLRIPGEDARPDSRRSAERGLSHRSSARADEHSRPSTVHAAPPPAPGANPAAAQRARKAGLTALYKGKVAAAVTDLERAAALDPGNDAIASDLQRARRIAATVKARR